MGEAARGEITPAVRSAWSRLRATVGVVDWLQIAAWAQVLSLAVAVAAGILLVYNNLSSKSLVLAASAFMGAVAVFAINLWTELQGGAPIRDRLSVEYTVDRQERRIRTWRYSEDLGPAGGAERLHVETNASHWLAGRSAAAFDGDRNRLSLDLALFSLIGLLAHREFDWQLRSAIFEGDVGGSYFQSERLSQPGECREVAPNDFATALKSAGNVFAGAPVHIFGGAVCLPPGGEMLLTDSSLALRTPICEVKFTVESSQGVNYAVPHTGGKVETLRGGNESRYETRVVGIVTQITKFDLRAHHRQAEKQVAWCQRVVDSARAWFKRAAPEPAAPLLIWDQPGPVAPVPE
jgi:hypothetical protein